ncbi:MAG: MAPEG family protein [Rhizobiaceae bacterium]|nr:MAPEG family protein [Rhizobiaceae bacterium]
MSLELTYLIFAIFLLLIQMLTQVGAGILQNGLMAAAGARDDEFLVDGVGGRFERAYYNMLETFPVFASLVLIIHMTESFSSVSALGVQLYFWGRVVYIPTYIISIPFVRTVVWLISMIGILLLAWPLLQQVT